MVDGPLISSVGDSKIICSKKLVMFIGMSLLLTSLLLHVIFYLRTTTYHLVPTLKGLSANVDSSQSPGVTLLVTGVIFFYVEEQRIQANIIRGRAFALQNEKIRSLNSMLERSKQDLQSEETQ